MSSYQGIISARPEKFDATTDPTANDDFTAGWAPGSEWLNQATGAIWKCFSSERGAAVWRQQNALIGDASANTVTAPGSTTPRTLAQRAGDVLTPYDFGAVGNGTADDTAKVQAAFNSGRTIAIPPGTFLCGPLTISTPGQKIVGMGGTLVASAAVTQATLILVTGDRVTLDSVTVDNPSEYKSQIGGKNTGIEIKANNVVVRGCTVRRFLMGIVQAHDGEYLGAVITGNRVLDVLGAGDGPSNTTSTYGEDRGDGITCFGAMSTVTGNLVTCKAGQDARIGIDIEGLETFKVIAPTYSDQISTVAGNVVIGAFRRAIAVEKVDYAAVTGNSCAGTTWWGINISRANYVTVSGNTVLYDRPSSNLSGEAWGPDRGGISLFGGMTGTVVAGNTIHVTGAANYGIGFIGPSNELHDRIIIDGNTVIGGTGLRDGLYLTFGNDVTVTGNVIQSATAKGIYLGDVAGWSLTGNTVSDCVDCIYGNHLDDSKTALISHNRLSNATNGLNIANSRNTTVLGNSLRSLSGVGIQLFGCDYLQVAWNALRGVATPLDQAGTTATRIVSNNLVV